MKYVIVSIEWLSLHGLLVTNQMRKSKDGSKVILHLEFVLLYDRETDFSENIISETEARKLMETDEWTWDETENIDTNFNSMIAIQNLLSTTKKSIQTLKLSNSQSLKVKSLYPQWNEYVGKMLKEKEIVQYEGNLYKVRQTILNVLENQFPSLDTASLYEIIVEDHTGKENDPIPYNPPMEIFNGKYYIQENVLYLCTRDSEIALNHNLNDLINIYVTKIEE